MKVKHKRSYLLLMPALGLSLALSAQTNNPATSTAPARPDTPAAAVATGTAPQHAPATATKGMPAGANVATAPASNEIPASRLIGKNITNAQKENLGEIKDLVIDTVNGKVQYAVVSFGGLLGLGDKLFAYPLQQFQFAAANDRDKLLLNVDKEKLKAAPGFDQKSWPDFNKSDYRAQVDKYHGTHAAPANVRYVRVSQMLKGDVKDPANKDIGDIKDVVINLKDGRAHYVVLDFDRAWNAKDQLVAMPMRALKAEDKNGTDLVYTASREELEKAPGFEKNRWPNVSEDTAFRADVDRYDRTFATRPAQTKQR